MMNHTLRSITSVLAAAGLALSTLAGTAALAQAAPAAIDLQSGSCPATIKQGQSSGCVTELQNLLKQQGQNPGASDGIFGAGTASAVKAFQKAAGLTQDALVGPATKSALYTRQVTIASANCPSLSNGSRGGCVGYLQARLNTVNSAKLVVDGKFGANSLTAVKNFQSARCLAVDGVVGPATKSAVVNNSSSCSVTPIPTPGPFKPFVPSPVQSSGSGWKLVNNTDYTAVPCAPGSTLLKSGVFETWGTKTDANGFYRNAGNGIKVRVCTIDSDPRKRGVASVISGNAVALFNAAAAAGHPLSINDGLRSYEYQTYFYNCMITKKCNNGNTAAVPGTSNHESGVAMDLATKTGGSISGTTTFTWLAANASKYGFYNYKPEPWHWSPSGA